MTEYATSWHGRRLRERGDPNVATCASPCPAHRIRPPSGPNSTVHPLKVADTCGRCHADAKVMGGYKTATDQLAKYKASVHWKTMTTKSDLSAPTCNDCHGNHGAAPPGHVVGGQRVRAVPCRAGRALRQERPCQAFVAMGAPGCATCHENHEIKEAGDDMLGLDDNTICSACHVAGDKGSQGGAAEMRRLIDALRVEHERARATLTAAEQAGMEVSQAQFELNGAKMRS